MQVVLVMFKADGSRREFPVKPDGFVIGRMNSCDLRVPISSVSRQHCVLKVESSRLLLRDAGSSNGTFHNKTRVTEAVLAPGDEVVIGPVVFTVMIDGKPNITEPVRTSIKRPAEDSDSVGLSDDLLEEVMQEIASNGKAGGYETS